MDNDPVVSVDDDGTVTLASGRVSTRASRAAARARSRELAAEQCARFRAEGTTSWDHYHQLMRESAPQAHSA